MTRLNRILVTALFAASVLGSSLCAQNGMNSPYSRYGLGKLGDLSAGVNRAMGSTGIGLRERNTINTLNPAAYSSVDTLTFLFDFGFSVQNGNFSENGVKLNARNTSMDYVAMQFRLARTLGCTVSVLPFSSVGYTFANAKVIRDDEDGEVVATNTFSGSGGLRQFNIGLGWKTFKQLSLGANFSYLFGDIQHQVDNTYSESTIYSRQKLYSADMSALKADFGVQTTFNLKGDQLTLGAVFQPAMNLHSDCYEVSNTINSSTILVTDTTTISDAFRIPMGVGAGFSYTHNRLTMAFDARYQQWSDGRAFNKAGADCLRLSGGMIFQPDKSNKNIFKRSIYRAGFSWEQPYYNLDNSVAGPTEYGVSAGISLPIINRWNGLSNVNIAGQYVHVKPAVSGLITENYLKLSVSISFNEIWFQKIQVQ